ncbi:hypothetical protein ACHAWF_017155 [Thalassiosira exigua]
MEAAPRGRRRRRIPRPSTIAAATAAATATATSARQGASRGASIVATRVAVAISMTSLRPAEARSWWSVEIPALAEIRDVDPLFGPSSTLLLEDAFSHGGGGSASTLVGGGRPIAEEVGGDAVDDRRPDADATTSEGSALQDVGGPPPSPGSVPTASSFAGAPSPPAPSSAGVDPSTPPGAEADVAADVVAGAEDPASRPPRPVPRPAAAADGAAAHAASADASAAPPVEKVGPHPGPSVAPRPEAPSSTEGGPAVDATATDSAGDSAAGDLLDVGGYAGTEPTSSPSRMYQAHNGGCPTTHLPHRVWLYDAADDGWGSTQLTIGEVDGSPSSGSGDGVDWDGASFAGSLTSEGSAAVYKLSADAAGSPGDSATAASAAGSMEARNREMGDSRRRLDGGTTLDDAIYLCLKRGGCYEATVSGGTFREEARWEVTKAATDGSGEDGALVAEGVGGGTGRCRFGVESDEDGGGGCPTTCDGTAQTARPTSSPSPPTSSPTQPPLWHVDILANATTRTVPSTPPPTARDPTSPPTPSPSDATVVVLPQDRPHSFGLDEHRRIRAAILDASPESAAALDDDESPQSRAFRWIYESGSTVRGHLVSDRRLAQRWALASFYYGAGGDEWIVRDGWLREDDECGWHGVTCASGFATGLRLDRNRLRGEIVPEVAYVMGHDLGVLSLGNNGIGPDIEVNQIATSLPPSFQRLTGLTVLNLEGVGLTSSIPEILFYSWPKLEFLSLRDNDLTGEVPGSVGRLASLEVLRLGGNNLRGTIPAELGMLTNVREISLESNFREDVDGGRGFVMSVPLEVGRLKNLEVLDLADNALSGQVPMQLSDLTSLRRLRLSGNFFESQLPPALGSMQLLEELDISNNWLSSTIPPEYGNMISLTRLSLQSNYNDREGYFTWGIKDKLPTELGKLRNLQHIDLSNNFISGTLVTEIGALSLLETLHLNNNFLSGPIPVEYSSCKSLEEILLQDNDIDGEKFRMPAEICNLPGLDLARVDCEVSCRCCVTMC